MVNIIIGIILLALALNGFVTLLTALCYAELASVYPKSRGGYFYS